MTSLLAIDDIVDPQKLRQLLVDALYTVRAARDDRGCTVLHWAAAAGADESVKLLVEASIDVNTTCSAGTPLHEAARARESTTLKLLLELGASVNSVASPSAADTTPLHISAFRLHWAGAKLLLEAAADVLLEDGLWGSPLEALEAGKHESVKIDHSNCFERGEVSYEGTKKILQYYLTMLPSTDQARQ